MVKKYHYTKILFLNPLIKFQIQSTLISDQVALWDPPLNELICVLMLLFGSHIILFVVREVQSFFKIKH